MGKLAIISEEMVLSCAIVGWLLLQVPLDEAATIAALVGAYVAMIYAIRSVFRGDWKTAETSVKTREP